MTSPPAFAWDDWYATVGGRSIRIPEVTDLLQEIFDHQYPRFDGDVAAARRAFASPTEAARASQGEGPRVRRRHRRHL